MDPITLPITPAGDVVGAVGLAVLTLCLVVAGTVGTRISQSALGYWLFGWAAMTLTGAIFAVGDRIPEGWVYAAFLTDALFAPLMFVGAQAYASRRPPIWPCAVGLVAGIARIGLDAAEMHEAQFVLALTVAPGFLLAAALSVFRTSESPPLRWPIACFLLAFGFVEVWDAHADWASGSVVVPWFASLFTGVPLGALQILSRFLSIRRVAISADLRSDRAERDRDLERWRFENVFDNARDLVIEIAEDSRVVYANAAAHRVFGGAAEQMIGRSSIDFLPPYWRARTKELWRSMLDASKRPVVVSVFDEQGRDRSLELTATRYTFRGSPRIVVFGRDVTDRLRDEKELAQYRDELERLVSERSEQLEESRSLLRDQEHLATVGTLAAGVAHQINNPVGVIVAASEYALRSEDQPDRDEVRRESLERVLDAAHRAGRIVRSLLKFARHEATPKWHEELQPVVHRACELSRGYVEGRGGKLVIAGQAESLAVVMSPIEIEQVLVNLIHNAIEAQPGGGEVRVGIRRVDAMAVIEVADDGIGIDTEARPRIFDPFFTTRLREGGSGLGLSVAHGVVVDHGGTITVESDPGCGTRIEIRLPLADGNPV